MATSSPYSQNDYSVFNYRPYQLPAQAIAQAFVAKNNAWEVGAQRVKSRYDSMLDLDLSKEENRKIRDEFMQKAQTDLQKLSTKDLSDPNIQRQGLTLFQPLLQDKGILYDDQATKHYKKILSDAEQLRKKDNGKYYNQANVQYALDGWDDFLKNPDRNSGQEYLQKAKEMTPYYDPSDEISKINKDCGANSVSNEYANGKYIDGTSDKSKSSAKIYGCLEAGLSSQAKEQLKIEAHVAYGKNYEALRGDFVESASDKKKYYQEELGSRQARIAALSKVKGNEAQIAQLKQETDALTNNISGINKDITSYQSWDVNQIKDNYDNLAYTAYSKRWKDAYSHAFATSDISHSTKANPVYISEFTQNQLNQRMSAGFAHDFSMSDYNFKQDVAMDKMNFDQAQQLENLKFQHDIIKGVDKNGEKMDPLERLTAMTRMGYTPDQIQQYIGSATQEHKDNGDVMAGEINTLAGKELEIHNDLFNRLKAELPDNDLIKSIGDNVNNPDDVKSVWRVAHDYLTHAPKNDPLRQKIIEAENYSIQTTNKRTALSSIYDTAKEKIAKQNPDIASNYNKLREQAFAQIQPTRLADGTVVDKQRAMLIAEGRDPRFKIEKLQKDNNTPQAIYIRDTQTGKLTDALPGVINAAFTMDRATKDQKSNFNQKLNDELGKNVLTQKMLFATGNIFTKGSSSTALMEQWLGAAVPKGGEIKSIGALDPETGEINVQVTDKDGHPLKGADLRAAVDPTVGASNIPEVGENYIRVKIPNAVGLIKTPEMDLVYRQLIDYATSNINNNRREFRMEAGLGKDGIKYELKAMKKIGGGVEYEILGNGVTMPLPSRGKEDVIKNLQLLLSPTQNG